MTVSVSVAEKTYAGPGRPRFAALSNVRFELADGEFTCLVGPSGCGKSTLLQILSGLDPHFSGRFAFDPAIGDDAPLGYVFQSPRLMPWLTIVENVDLVASPRSREERRAEMLLEQMDLGEVMHTFPNRLSGGMQRRVSLARAFVNRPRYLFLDEPFVSLDAPVARRLHQLLLDLWAETRCTVLFVTHDLREAIYLADRILFMSRSPGRIAHDYAVELPRPRDPDSPDIERIRDQLLAAHPEILSGIAQPAAAESAAGD